MKKLQMAKHRECLACHGPSNEAKIEKGNRSKDVLDIRIVPGDTNAWVECYENTYDEDAVVGNAEYNAQIENARLQQHLMKKQEKLKIFQNEVKRRVSNLERLKREDAQQKYLKRVEDEHNLVLQRTLGIRLPYQGSIDELQHLNKELLKSCIIPCNNDKQLQTIICEVEKSDQKVDEVADAIKKENISARSKLLSKKLKKYEVELPGGNWKSPSQKQNTYNIIESASNEAQKIENPSQHSKACKSVDDEELQSKKNVRFDEDLCTQFDVNPESDNLQMYLMDEQLKNRLNFIYEIGKYEEDEKMQKQNQYWKFRKLFMEIERDQVKEKKMIKDHRKRVQSLKLVKEEERKIAEKMMTKFQGKPIQNPPPFDQLSQKSVLSKEKKLFQDKEMYRYMEALRKVAKERIEVCNVTIPPLCSCGPSFWDSHPDKCANNCVFYKNIKVYVSALTSALASTR